MPAENNTSATTQSQDAEDEIKRRTGSLTPEQKRILAAKLYAMLREDLSLERERLALPHRLF